jgi:hypothetical protein
VFLMISSVFLPGRPPCFLKGDEGNRVAVVSGSDQGEIWA